MFRDNQNYFSCYSFSINWSHRWQKWPKHSLDVCIHVLSFIFSWMWCCWYNFPFDTSSVPLLLVSTNRGGRRGLFVSPLHRKPDEKSSRDEMVCLELEPACTNIWDKMKRDETWGLLRIWTKWNHFHSVGALTMQGLLRKQNAFDFKKKLTFMQNFCSWKFAQ